MDYQKVYDQIMDRAKSSYREKGYGEYYEEHHIKPMFLFKESRSKRADKGRLEGNPNHKDNKVLLTFREHLIAHMLLAKIYKGTIFEYQAVSSVLLMLPKKGNPDRTSRTAALVKREYSKKLSDMKKGTLLVKDAKTGVNVGFVPLDHPKVLSREWVFYQTGVKKSEEFKKKISKPKELNANYSGFTDAQLEESYVELYDITAPYVPTVKVWMEWAKQNNKPYLTSIKPFRFDGAGLTHFYAHIKEVRGVEYDEYFTRNKDNIEFCLEVEKRIGIDIVPANRKKNYAINQTSDCGTD